MENKVWFTCCSLWREGFRIKEKFTGLLKAVGSRVLDSYTCVRWLKKRKFTGPLILVAWSSWTCSKISIKDSAISAVFQLKATWELPINAKVARAVSGALGRVGETPRVKSETDRSLSPSPFIIWIAEIQNDGSPWKRGAWTPLASATGIRAPGSRYIFSGISPSDDGWNNSQGRFCSVP